MTKVKVLSVVCGVWARRNIVFQSLTRISNLSLEPLLNVKAEGGLSPTSADDLIRIGFVSSGRSLVVEFCGVLLLSSGVIFQV